MGNLAIDLRPSKLADVIGQPHVVELLTHLPADARLVLFYGPSGVGKTTIARIYARMINCTAEDKPCGVCTNCRDPLLFYRWDVPTKNKVDQVVEMMTLSRMATPAGTRRVILADEAHGLTPTAFDKLLDFFESEPKNFQTGETLPFPTLFIFSTTELPKIPVTIQSRATIVRFKRLLPDDISTYLSSLEIAAPQEAIAHISTTCNGNMRTALQQLGAIQGVEDWKTILLPEVDTVQLVLDAYFSRKWTDLLGAITRGATELGLKGLVEQLILRVTRPDAVTTNAWRNLVSACYRVQFSASESIGLAQLYNLLSTPPQEEPTRPSHEEVPDAPSHEEPAEAETPPPSDVKRDGPAPRSIPYRRGRPRG